MTSATCSCTYPEAGGQIVLCDWHRQEFTILMSRMNGTWEIAEYAGAMRLAAECGLHSLHILSQLTESPDLLGKSGMAKIAKAEYERLQVVFQNASKLTPRARSEKKGKT